MVTILTQGHPVLEQPCAPVTWPDTELDEDVDRLRTALEEFRRSHGFGRAISAPQIGISKRLIYIHVPELTGAIVNPQITWRSDEQFEVWDDCLSVPDHIVKVRRHCSISLDYRNQQGASRQWQQLSADMSELLQHEIDHLDGILMTTRAVDADSVRPISERAELIDAARSPTPAT